MKPLPSTATSNSRPVSRIGPREKSVPVVVSATKARVDCPGPSTGRARNAVVSARKPAVETLARLCEICACRSNMLRAPFMAM